MKFSMLKKELQQALKEVRPAVAARSHLPVLAGVRLEAAAGRLDLQATDLELTIRLQVRASTSPEGPVVTPALIVPAKALANAVGAMPGPQVVLETSDGDARPALTVSSGSRQVVLEQTFPVEEWPSVGEGIEWQPLCRVEAAELSDALSRVVLCASDDPVRPVLTGVQVSFQKNGGAAEFVATDSYRLGVVTVDASGVTGIPERPIIIPAGGLKALAKKLERAEGDVALHVGRAAQDSGAAWLIEFTFGAASWAVRVLEGQFPDWRRLLPGEEGGLFEYDAKELAAAVKGAASLASSRSVPIRVVLEEPCHVRMMEAETATFSQVLKGATFSPNGAGAMEVCLNAAFLTDAIRFCAKPNSPNGEAQSRMWVREPLKPVLFSSRRGRYLLMPIRLR